MTNAINLASMIDHTLLKPTATKQQIIQVCNEALEHKFASVCVNPYNVGLVAQHLKGSQVKTCTVIGFPLGANASMLKVNETELAIADGAQEIDMVINVAALLDRDFSYVANDINSVVKAANGMCVKVIIETCYLTDQQKITACELAKSAGASFVKTSTGFGPSGANAHDVALMRQVVGSEMGVKASGGIKTLNDAITMINAGASRLGTSAGVAIVTGCC